MTGPFSSISPTFLRVTIGKQMNFMFLSNIGRFWIIDIHYTLDGSEPSSTSPRYLAPLSLKGPQTIRAQVFIAGKRSPYEAIRELRRHLALGKSLEVPENLNPRYAGNVVDGLHASDYYRDGAWLGMRGQDLVLTIDLGEKQSIQKIETRFLQDHARDVFLPLDIQYELSNNGNKFKSMPTTKIGIPAGPLPRTIRSYFSQWQAAKARYIRLTISHPGKIPSWHPKAGASPLFLLDEVVVE